VTKSSTRLAFVGSHALGGVSTISKSHRKSLDGSFSVLGASSSGLPAPRSSLRRDRGCWSPANGVCNSTPLSNDDDGDEDSRFGLRCSNVASPILRATNSSSSGEPSLGGIGGVGDAQRDSAIDAAHNLQGSQLSKELVFSHSYIPKRLPANPLGIYPRRPINSRARDLTFYTAFSTSRITSALTPVINRIQTGFHQVVETMSPRKRPPARTRSSPNQGQSQARSVESPSKQTLASLKLPPNSSSYSSSTSFSTRSGIFFIVLAFASSLSLLYFLYTKTPQLTDEERSLVKYPRSIEDAKGLAKVLSAYKDDHFEYIVLGFFAIYNFLQTFAIPGSIFLSILSGFLFPFPLACFLVSLCSALGASFCYLLSSFVGKPIMNRYFASRVEEWRQHVDRQRHNLLSYIIFLRITPFLPNWFINITSPIINVPLTHFFIGTFIGVAPPSFVYISAGQTVHTLTSTSSILTWYQIGLLAAIALLSLLPVLLKDKLKKKFE